MRLVKTQAKVAKFFDVTWRAVAQWKARGMPTTEDGMYDLDAIRAWRAKNMNTRMDPTKESKMMEKVAQLRMNTDMGAGEIGKLLCVPQQRVQQIVKKIDMYRPHLDMFKQNRADLFAIEQMEYLSHITEQKLEDAAPDDLAKMAKMAYEKERLERGESTENVLTIVKHIKELKARKEQEENANQN